MSDMLYSSDVPTQTSSGVVALTPEICVSLIRALPARLKDPGAIRSSGQSSGYEHLSRAMSQARRSDISKLFKPTTQVVPQKRATPEADEDTIVVNLGNSTPSTPSTNRNVKRNGRPPGVETPVHRAGSPLTTPRSGRSVSIPIRSPSGRTPTTIRQSLTAKTSTSATASSTRRNLEASFADVSSSIPSSIPSSSRRIEQHGKLVAVRDSDSDDSIGDLSTILKKPVKPMKDAANVRITRLDKEDMERRRLLEQFTNGRSEVAIMKQELREQEIADEKARQKLKLIFDEERKDRERDERIAEANAELEASNMDISEVRQRQRDKGLLAAILKGDDEDIGGQKLDRLMEAVDRTELFTADTAYSFFRRTGQHSSSEQRRKPVSFPQPAISSSLWEASDLDAQDQTFVSGFMTELASSGEVDDRALRWTFEAALLEHNEHLRAQYLDCVAAGSKTWTRANVTPEDINDIFVGLGAELEALQENTTIESRVQGKRDDQHGESKPLLKALGVMSAICQDMDFATLGRLCSITIRLSLDREVSHSLPASQAVEGLLCKLINLREDVFRNHVHERLRTDLSENVTEPALQAQFLDQLLPTTPYIARLRKQLAARFLLPPERVEKFLARPSLRSLKRHVLRSNHFRPKTLTSTNVTSEDYRVLTSLTTILDILVADGYPPATIMSKAEELEFNASVDSFADRIHALFVSIADSGASHMRRTEAKDALQALHHRLIYSVRTTAKPKRHVFDFRTDFGRTSKRSRSSLLRPVVDIEQEERDRRFMKDFFVKKQGSSNQDGPDNIVAESIPQSSPAEFADAMEQQ